VSIGVAIYQAGEAAEMLLARADAALYRAQTEGRNRVVAASEEDGSNSTETEPEGAAPVDEFAPTQVMRAVAGEGQTDQTVENVDRR